MIIIELTGGLGCQMSYYASGFFLARKNKQEFKIDTSYLNSWRIKGPWYRRPEILKMNISADVATKKDVRRFLFKTSISYIDAFVKRKRLFSKNVYHRVSDLNDILSVDGS